MLTLLGFFIGYSSWTISFFYQLFEGTRYSNTYFIEEPYRAFNAIGTCSFMVTHWLFTSHYLIMAMNFSLNLTSADLDAKRKCKHCLLLLDIIVYCASITMVFVGVFCNDKSKQLFEVYWVAQMWLLSIVSGFSFWKIKEKTQALHSIGVFADKTFMILYFTFMFSATIGSTINQGLELIDSSAKYGEKSGDEKARMKITT